MPTALDEYRLGEKPAKISRKKAIRAKCLDCCGNQYTEVRECTSWSCPLWAYRMGTKVEPATAWRYQE